MRLRGAAFLAAAFLACGAGAAALSPGGVVAAPAAFLVEGATFFTAVPFLAGGVAGALRAAFLRAAFLTGAGAAAASDTGWATGSARGSGASGGAGATTGPGSIVGARADSGTGREVRADGSASASSACPTEVSMTGSTSSGSAPTGAAGTSRKPD